MGIRKAEADILTKAKQEMKKIEEYKNKFRQSAFGGVITNNLASSIDRISSKYASIEVAPKLS